MQEPMPDLTEEAVEIPKPPPVPKHRPTRAATERRDEDRPSLLDFDAVASSYPPAMVVHAEHYYRRPMWASRASFLRAPAREVIRDGVSPYAAYAISALVGVAVAVALFVGLM